MRCKRARLVRVSFMHWESCACLRNVMSSISSASFMQGAKEIEEKTCLEPIQGVLAKGFVGPGTNEERTEKSATKADLRA